MSTKVDDIRGCAVNSKMGILASGSFRQFTYMDELIGEAKKLEYAKKNTTLPDEPDYRRIMEFTAYVNERVVKGEI